MQRKCAGCNEMKNREEMIKITKNYKDGSIVINPDSVTFGRSVYLCYNQSCINKALKKSKLNRALKTSAAFDKTEIYKMVERFYEAKI